MKKITKKLIFDLIMALLWVVLMIYSLTGAYWHEVLGLVMLGLFAIHITYNIPKMKKEIPRMFQYGRTNVTLRYSLDLILMIFGVLTGVSGVLISQEILTGIEAANIPLWTSLHYLTAYIAMGAIALHVGLHMKVILAVVGKPFKKYPIFPGLAKPLWNLAIIGVILYGFIASTNIDYTANFETAAATDESEAQVATTTVQSSTTDQIATPSLSEFLSNLTCTACPRNCPLIAPQCGRADAQIQSAEEEYNQLYGSTEDLQITVGNTTYSSNLS